MQKHEDITTEKPYKDMIQGKIIQFNTVSRKMQL
jgi:hypothetical protein